MRGGVGRLQGISAMPRHLSTLPVIGEWLANSFPSKPIINSPLSFRQFESYLVFSTDEHFLPSCPWISKVLVVLGVDHSLPSGIF